MEDHFKDGVENGKATVAVDFDNVFPGVGVRPRMVLKRTSSTREPTAGSRIHPWWRRWDSGSAEAGTAQKACGRWKKRVLRLF